MRASLLLTADPHPSCYTLCSTERDKERTRYSIYKLPRSEFNHSMQIECEKEVMYSSLVT